MIALVLRTGRIKVFIKSSESQLVPTRREFRQMVVKAEKQNDKPGRNTYNL
jgi:hypothetical protein